MPSVDVKVAEQEENRETLGERDVGWDAVFFSHDLGFTSWLVWCLATVCLFDRAMICGSGQAQTFPREG